MKAYTVTIEGEIVVEAENEIEAEKKAFDRIGRQLYSYQAVDVKCFCEEGWE